jgi:TPR repeat protein
MKFSNITTLIVPFLLLCECNEKAFAENSQIIEQVITQPEKLTSEQKLAKLQKEAEDGNVSAQFDLANMYADGVGVPKDEKKAIVWFEKAANQGYDKAQNEIGVRYYIGNGVEKDMSKAATWMEKAAKQGMAGAQLNLGQLYLKGHGVPKDLEVSAHWMIKAAAQGIFVAQNNLGAMYETGMGIVKDDMRAYAWYNLAASKGYDNGRLNRDRIEKKLTKMELVEGQRLSSNWKLGDTLLASNNNLSSITSPNHEPTKQKTGTAFVVSKNGHALTNHHVINGCDEIKIAGHDGVVKLITSDSTNDIALLQLPSNNDNFAKINPEPNKLRQGEDVIVFGYPLNSVLSSGGNLTFGTVSALSGLNNNTNQIQITAPIQPGSSGSPVMDKKGDIVGIVSMKLDDTKMAKATGSIGQTINFAVNGQTVKTFLGTNNVPYKTGGGFFSMEKNNADIAEEAKKWTVLVECWK